MFRNPFVFWRWIIFKYNLTFYAIYVKLSFINDIKIHSKLYTPYILYVFGMENSLHIKNLIIIYIEFLKIWHVTNWM